MKVTGTMGNEYSISRNPGNKDYPEMKIPHSINQVHDALRKAGKEIRNFEKSGILDIKYKSDLSPLTIADDTSNSVITGILKNIFPDIPVLSEEDDIKPETKGCCDLFWLLDPLDGTKEFIKGNGEYCISLALIEKGRPVEAYIYWPTKKILWYAIKGEGAYRVKDKEASKLPLKNPDKKSTLLLLRSRSHHKHEEVLWYEKASLVKDIEIQQQGSAIKFCFIAEGSADFYIKKGKIHGWDIAAGDLILSESGGKLMAYGLTSEISYNYDKSEMPHFIACSYRIDKPENWLF